MVDIERICHEWHTPEGESFFVASGISERNWRILMRHRGLADGKTWSLRELGREEGISHVRVLQIVRKAERRLKAYIERG